MPAAPPTVRIRLFATAREAVGVPLLSWPVPPTGVVAAELIRQLGTEYPRVKPTLQASRFVCNGEYLTSLRVRVRPGDEFAVHPPYGGG